MCLLFLKHSGENNHISPFNSFLGLIAQKILKEEKCSNNFPGFENIQTFWCFYPSWALTNSPV
jgi:hypothetical protein